MNQPLAFQLLASYYTRSEFSLTPLSVICAPGYLRMLSYAAKRSVPSAVFRGAVTSHGEVVYCSCLGSDVVHEYSTACEQWRTLPPCPVAGFGLAVVAGCLTLVGGEETRRETKRTILTNSLYVFLQKVLLSYLPKQF